MSPENFLGEDKRESPVTILHPRQGNQPMAERRHSEVGLSDSKQPGTEAQLRLGSWRLMA